MGRFRRLQQIQRLDPERDYERILQMSVAYEFPWDYLRSLELALFRTFAVPSIGRLLAATGEFANAGQRRYDDTVLILHVALSGLETRNGRAAVRRLNRIHGRYHISNDDFRYVLATFVVVPVRWIARYGWRPLSEHEVRAAVKFYHRLGELMGITDIPGTYDEFAELMDGYERGHFHYDPGNKRVATATLDLFGSWWPRPVRRLAAKIPLLLLDDPLLAGLGMPKPWHGLRLLADTALRTRARVVRWMPARRDSLPSQPRPRSYPNGWSLDMLGPDWVRGGESASPDRSASSAS